MICAELLLCVLPPSFFQILPHVLLAFQVSHIINCAGRHVPNMWAQNGIRYLTFYWEDDPNFPLFDAKGPSPGGHAPPVHPSF